MSLVRDLWLLLMHCLLNGYSAKARYFSTSCCPTRGMSAVRVQEVVARGATRGNAIHWQHRLHSLGQATALAICCSDGKSKSGLAIEVIVDVLCQLHQGHTIQELSKFRVPNAHGDYAGSIEQIENQTMLLLPSVVTYERGMKQRQTMLDTHENVY